LKKLLDEEGANLGDPDWRGMLGAIGIVQGQPFQPDAATRTILDRAAKTGYKMSRVIGFEENVGERSFQVYPDRRWVSPVADATILCAPLVGERAARANDGPKPCMAGTPRKIVLRGSALPSG
jgi:hypothetical protein